MNSIQVEASVLVHAYQSGSLHYVTFSLSGHHSSVCLGIMPSLNRLVIKSSVTSSFSPPFCLLLLYVSAVCTLCCDSDLLLCLLIADTYLPVPLDSSCSASCLFIPFKPVLLKIRKQIVTYEIMTCYKCIL